MQPSAEIPITDAAERKIDDLLLKKVNREVFQLLSQHLYFALRENDPFDAVQDELDKTRAAPI